MSRGALRSVPRVKAPCTDAVEEVTRFLATLPTPEQIIAFRTSPAVAVRIAHLLEKNRETGLSGDEEREWEMYEYAGHLVRMAKANAMAEAAHAGAADQARLDVPPADPRVMHPCKRGGTR